MRLAQVERDSTVIHRGTQTALDRRFEPIARLQVQDPHHLLFYVGRDGADLSYREVARTRLPTATGTTSPRIMVGEIVPVLQRARAAPIQPFRSPVRLL
jgi:hypothetical protein